LLGPCQDGLIGFVGPGASTVSGRRVDVEAGQSTLKLSRGLASVIHGKGMVRRGPGSRIYHHRGRNPTRGRGPSARVEHHRRRNSARGGPRPVRERIKGLDARKAHRRGGLVNGVHRGHRQGSLRIPRRSDDLLQPAGTVVIARVWVPGAPPPRLLGCTADRVSPGPARRRHGRGRQQAALARRIGTAVGNTERRRVELGAAEIGAVRRLKWISPRRHAETATRGP